MTVEVVALVYRDPAFLRSIASELAATTGATPWRIVGNDPLDRVIAAARDEGVPFDVYHDDDPDDWYLSRVYRAWNYCVASSTADTVVLVNSDMIFAGGWLTALTARLDGATIPVSRLVEPCKHRPLATSPHCIQADLGRHPSTFPRAAWTSMTATLTTPTTGDGGAFMPAALPRGAFLSAGGYPEGNVLNGIVVRGNPPSPLPTGYTSGDAYLFDKLAQRGYRHLTCYDSLVYHMQEGEMSQ